MKYIALNAEVEETFGCGVVVVVPGPRFCATSAEVRPGQAAVTLMRTNARNKNGGDSREPEREAAGEKCVFSVRDRQFKERELKFLRRNGPRLAEGTYDRGLSCFRRATPSALGEIDS